MKNTTFLMALSAVMMFASCSKQEGGGQDDKAGKVSLSVKIDMSKFTKSGDDNIYENAAAIPAWDNLLLVVAKADGTVVEEKTYTKTEYGALVGGKATLLDKSKVDVTGGTVTAYITTTGHAWGTITAKTTPNLPILAAGELDINKWQASGNIKTGVSGDFVNVPYYGKSAAITKTGVTADGRELLEATVAVTPELGRIQVIKAPTTGGALNNVTVTSLTVSNIYINKITSGGTVAAPSTIDIRTLNTVTNVDPATWKTNFYASTDKPLGGMWDAITDRSTPQLTNKGYQIFNGNTPHVIVEVLYKLTEDGKAEGTEKTGYLTITKFTYDAITADDLTVSKGKIYNIDLSKLQPSFNQITDDPYDNTTYYDLIATVTVAPWTVVNVTPVL